MICHRCKENIEVGEVCITERINGSEHYWYFHLECYVNHSEEQKQAEQQLECVRTMAGLVH